MSVKLNLSIGKCLPLLQLELFVILLLTVFANEAAALTRPGVMRGSSLRPQRPALHKAESTSFSTASGCGNFLLTGTTGQIVLSEADYVENTQCTWTVAPTSDLTVVGIRFSFDWFSLDADSDYLGFYDGAAPPIVPLAIKTGEDTSAVELSVENAAVMLFSDSVRSNPDAAGFQLTYEAIFGTVESPTPTPTSVPVTLPLYHGCHDAPITDVSAQIGADYDSDITTCTWSIEPDINPVLISFSFDLMDLEEGDLLQFFDASGTLVAERTGNDDTFVTITGAKATVQLVTDGILISDVLGFLMTYVVAVEDEVFTPTPTPSASAEPTASPLTSPSPTPLLYSACPTGGVVSESSAQIWVYDTDYVANSTCTWLVNPSASATGIITSFLVVFALVDIESLDYLRFYDGANPSVLLAERTGQEASTLVLSASSLVIQFNSDFIRLDDGALGFKLTFYAIYDYDCTAATTIRPSSSETSTWSFGVGSPAVDAVRAGARTRKLMLRAQFSTTSNVAITISTGATFSAIFNMYSGPCPYSASSHVGLVDLRLVYNPNPYRTSSNISELFIVVEALEWNETSSFDVTLSSSSASLVEDPHVKSWDGVAHTVKGEGDYLLATSPSHGLTVHGRFCKSSRGPWASWTCAIAVRCRPSAPVIEVDARKFQAALPSDESTAITAISSSLKTINCAEVLEVHLMRHRFHRHSYLNVRLNLLLKAPADIRGLIGTPNGDKSDDLQHRSGELFAAPPGVTHLIGHNLPALDAVHNSWLVSPAERIFSTPFQPIAAVLGPNPPLNVHIQKSRPSAEAVERRCKSAGLDAEVDIAICVYDFLALGHQRGAPNLAHFLHPKPAFVAA